MADGNRVSGTCTHECQTLVLEKLHLSAGKPGADSDTCGLQNPSQAVWAPTNEAAVRLGNLEAPELKPSPKQLHSNDHDHDLKHQANELATMLRSSTESSAEATQHNPTPNLRPKDATSTSSVSAHQPLRQDSFPYSTQDEGSELDVDVQARQIRARERVLILRRRVVRTRRQLKGRRDELRQLRENAQHALDKLMKKVNESEGFGKWQENLHHCYEDLRKAQDILGPAEYTHGRLESQLDDEEQDLEEEEDHFYRHYDITAVSVAESKVNDVISPLVKPYAPPEIEVVSLNLNPESSLVQEYSEKVLEAGRLKEELDVLEEDYFQLSTDASFRKRHNITLSTETATFLLEYPQLHENTLKNLHAVEDDVFGLRDKCLQQGIFKESENLYEPRDALYEDVMNSVYDARDRLPLRIAAHESEYDARQTNFRDKREYVNNWLLQWIQDSAFESLILKTWIYFEYPERPEKQNALSDDKWSDLAIENWDSDSAGRYANECHSANKLDAIAGETGRLNTRLNTSITGRSGVSDSLGSLDAYFGDAEKETRSWSEAESHDEKTLGDGGSTPRSSPKKGEDGVG